MEANTVRASSRASVSTAPVWPGAAPGARAGGRYDPPFDDGRTDGHHSPLHGIRIIEASALGPAVITMPPVHLGAEVIKVEPPEGDYIREMTWPIIEGVSLMHLHINRGSGPRPRPAHRGRRRDLPGPRGLRRRRGRGDAPRRPRPPRGRLRGPAGRQPPVGVLHDFGLRDDRSLQGLPLSRHRRRHVGRDRERGHRRRRVHLPHRARFDRIHAGPLFGALGILAAVLRARKLARARTSRSPSPTRRRPWTGTAARPGGPTSDPSPR